MAKYKFIPIDIYKRQVDVFIGDRIDFVSFIKTKYDKDSEYQDIVDSIFDTNDDSTAASHWFLRKYGNCIIQLKEVPKTTRDIAVCGHEVLHSVFDMLDFVGVEFVPNGANEAYTYLFEHIMTELLDFKTYKTL